MTIWYVSAEYFPVEIAISIRSSFNVEELLRRGYDVKVLASGTSRKGRNGEEVIGVGSSIVGNRKSLPHRLWLEIKLAICLISVLWKNQKLGDLVIITTPPFFTLLLLATYCSRQRIPYVVDVRDRYPEVLFSQKIIGRKSLVGFCLKIWEKKVYRASTAITTVTQPLCENIQEDCGVSPILIMNGFDSRIFKSRLGTKNQQPRVNLICHGLFGRLFDFETFSNVAKFCLIHANPHQFTLVGYGEALERVKKLQLKNVLVLPVMSQAQIADTLQHADIGISILSDDLSSMQAFPVKVFEYLGAALPVFCIPKNVAGQEINQKKFGAAFDRDNWSEGAVWLVNLINCSADRERISKIIQQNRLNYSRQTQCSRFSDLIQQVVADLS